MGSTRVPLAILGALAAGAALAWGLGGGAPTPEAAPSGPSGGWEPAVEELRQALGRERAAREELAEALASLERRVATPPAPGRAIGALPGAEEDDEDLPPGSFEAEALALAGVADAEIDRLREAFDASELAILELRDQAQREGWAGSRRYREDLAALREQTRAQLGDEAYDQLLYATGRKNRIEVAQLMSDSPGLRWGLEEGDMILSYADRRVFGGDELRRATHEGTPGERVPVLVLRDCEPLHLWIPRGPIGARLRAQRTSPSAC